MTEQLTSKWCHGVRVYNASEADTALRALVQQWRAFSAELRVQAEACKQTDDWELKQALEAEATRLDSCADALATLLGDTK